MVMQIVKCKFTVYLHVILQSLCCTCIPCTVN